VCASCRIPTFKVGGGIGRRGGGPDKIKEHTSKESAEKKQTLRKDEDLGSLASKKTFWYPISLKNNKKEEKKLWREVQVREGEKRYWSEQRSDAS